jgi:hypothetical protein
LPENGVAKLSVAYSLIAILHKIFMFGAYRLILTSYYMLSAVVSLIPFSWAHIKSFSFLMGFEYTMFSKETPALMLD